MIYRILADSVLVLHLMFIAFVMSGGLLMLRWPRLLAAHLPAVCWAVLVELSGWTCPLTPLETHWRQAAGAVGYQGGFIEHYLLPLIYPAGLTRDIQLVLASLVILVNLGVYGCLWHRRRPG